MNMRTDSNSDEEPTVGSKTWEYLATGSCCIMALSFGTVNGWNSPSGVKLLAPDSPIAMTPSEFSTVVILNMIGIALGPPINAFVVDRIGRKNTILLSAVPLILCWSLITIATNIWALYIARFAGGLFFGISQCACPMYIGEISSPTTRGFSTAITLIGYDTGTLITFISVPYLSMSASAGVFLAIAITFVILFYFLPESPYYLAMRNKLKDTKDTLQKLRGKTDVAEDLAIIMASLPVNESGHVGSSRTPWKDVFTVRSNRRAFVIELALSIARYFGGFYTIYTYGQLIFRETSYAISDYMANVSVGMSLLISTIAITLLVDKVGRRPLIWYSGISSGLCCFAIAGFFYVADYLDLDVSDFALVPFIASLILVFVLPCGLASLQYIMLAELFSTDIKAVSTTLIGVIGAVFAAINSKFYMAVAVSWGYGNALPFLVSGIIVWICTIILLYYTPETKGKSLAEIQQQLNRKR